MKYYRYISFVLFLLLLSGCIAENEGDVIYDEAMRQIMNQYEGEGIEHPLPSIYSDKKSLSGTLTLWNSPWDHHLAILARRFMEANPDTRVIIERFDAITDIVQLAALTSRMLIEPPDLFHTGVIFPEKMVMEALFLELNDFLDGVNGICRDDYFNGILRGAEVNGNLYHVPLMIGTDMILLNKQLFSSIGLQTSDIKELTLDQYFEYRQMASERHPDITVNLDPLFYIMDMFGIEDVYDVTTKQVWVNTPEMRRHLLTVKQLPFEDVTFTPDGPLVNYGMGSTAVDTRRYFYPEATYMYERSTDLISPYLFFILDHPNMQYSHPVHRVSRTGNVRYRVSTGLAVMRDSANKELALEFLRFCMEHSTSLWDGQGYWNTNLYSGTLQFPVNRELFNNQVGAILYASYDVQTEQRFIAMTGDEVYDAAVRDEQVEYALSAYRGLMESFNYEYKYNAAVMNSLIYPDIYLFITDRQNVDTTLANIQNRLELYVAE